MAVRKSTSEKDESLLIKAFGNSPKLRIVDFFLDNKLFDFSKKEVIEETGMSKPTLYKYWDDLTKFGLIKETRKFGKAKLYALNMESPVVQELIEIERRLIEQSVGKARGT